MSKRRRKKSIPSHHQRKPSYIYRCTQCGLKEDIPEGVVDFFNATDPGDPVEWTFVLLLAHNATTKWQRTARYN